VDSGRPEQETDEPGLRAAHCGAFAGSGHGGFTLLEVLLALAIIGIAVTAIVELFSANLRGISVSDEQVRATLTAEAKMREVIDAGGLDEKSWTEVTSDGYRVDVAISKVQVERTQVIGAHLFQISLALSWRQGTRNKTIRLTTLKLALPGEEITREAASG
jgi:type II secretion system protein I